MLAYVFWHWPEASASVPLYEQAMLDFHSALASARCEALMGSRTFRVEGEPWLPEGRGYADWYLLDGGSASLDILNDLAMSETVRTAHDRPALLAAGGAGGVYRLLNGSASITPAAATWFSKPRRSISYQEITDRLQSWTDRPGVTLWRRQMVLGPAREFCLQSLTPLELPAEMEHCASRWTPLG